MLFSVLQVRPRPAKELMVHQHSPHLLPNDRHGINSLILSPSFSHFHFVNAVVQLSVIWIYNSVIV